MHNEEKTRTFRDVGTLRQIAWFAFSFMSSVELRELCSEIFPLEWSCVLFLWVSWAVCVLWCALNFVSSVEFLTRISRRLFMSSICDNMFSDKYNSRANPCNLFWLLRKKWQISCETKLSLIFLGNTMLRCQKEGEMSSQSPRGISHITISSKPNQWPSYQKKNLNSTVDTF